MSHALGLRSRALVLFQRASPPFDLQIDAQTGKTISATAAELLKRLAGAL